MKWKIEYLQSVVKQVKKLDPGTRKRIRNFLENRLADREDPRQLGKALQGRDEIWRYRVGDYRILCQIIDQEIVVLVIDIDHRSVVYRKNE